MEQTRVAQPTSWSVVVSDDVAAMDLICPDGSPAFIEPLTTSRAISTLVDGRCAQRVHRRRHASTLLWHGPAELALTP
jgi:hypothetical protein